MLTTHSLDGAWTLEVAEHDAEHPAPALPGTIPATVPGTVHTDLLAAGLIEDPYLGTNEPLTAWIGHTGWRYRRTLDWSPQGAERVDLVFDGLDTVATVELNGEVVARTANQHRSYRIDVTGRLSPGENELVVTFASAWRHAQELESALGPRPNAYPTPFNFIRKMAANFGWDWGPQLVTAGIWRGVRLESWSGARIASLRPTVGVDGADGTVSLELALEVGASFAGGTVSAEVAGVRVEVPASASGEVDTVVLRVPDAPRWWPRGYGDQPLHELVVELADATGQVLHSRGRRIGFRSVRLDTTEDEHGTAFTVVVNDTPVLVRGANWIPDDCFLPRVTPERYRQRIEQAVAANLNLLRVWGGGIYESEAFYDVCDELGVLTWQDFLFACAAYPEDEPLAGEVAAEARENVERLMSHPSLALLNGANENIWGWYDWGWQEELGDRSWGLGYYTELLPAVVDEVAPQVPYWPNSPYSGDPDRHPNDPRHANVHIWDVWNRRDHTGYEDWTPRFVSEFGFQGPPTWATLTQAVEAEPSSPESPAMLLHQKAVDGNAKLSRWLQGHLPEPRDMAEWHYLTQLNQARAITTAVERFRSMTPLCTGTILWQLNDCWPVTSWAMVDGYGRLKPLWHAVRRASEDRILVWRGSGAERRLVAVNDTATWWTAEVTVTRTGLGGEVLGELREQLEVPPRRAAELALAPMVAEVADPRTEVLVARAPGAAAAVGYHVPDPELALEPADVRVQASPWRDGQATLTLSSPRLVRSVVLLVDHLHPDAAAGDAAFDLLPGEEVRVVVRAPEPLELDDLAARGLVRTVNDLVVAARGV
ncbi:glycoside hydrolase family 2 protein [Auraticoccus sp. F435]|uniref:beta-mannosidase n=1 Tax=Auraticoccus cholistanensis TaxID=2656650 RepID=A0A6A9UYM2_9ACTN|nr:glycoside hydrolase family 2 protein [Auraticoccus cholistanensis]MVA76687.1 glycoside hydrolase family 2 protein [Auraticoccus cholistanensis]